MMDDMFCEDHEPVYHQVLSELTAVQCHPELVRLDVDSEDVVFQCNSLRKVLPAIWRLRGDVTASEAFLRRVATNMAQSSYYANIGMPFLLGRKYNVQVKQVVEHVRTIKRREQPNRRLQKHKQPRRYTIKQCAK
jgi:hypothetical protein